MSNGSKINAGMADSSEMETESRSEFRDWALRIRESDRDAYAAVFQSMSAKLVRYAQNITRDQASAYDVIQDVFLKLWTIRDRINPDSSLQSLLYTMTRNTAINLNRKLSPMVHSDSEGGEQFDLADGQNSPLSDAVFEAKNLAGHLKEWINELPGRRKEAFVLSRHHDLSHREISEIMGLSERTVNTHIFLALKFLRTRLNALQNDTAKR